MSKYLGPVCKLCRREGEKLYLKGERCFTPKCAFERRSFAPGQHGKPAAAAATAPAASPIIRASCAPSRTPAAFMEFWNVSSAAIMKLHNQRRGLTGLNLLQILEIASWIMLSSALGLPPAVRRRACW